MGSLGLDPTFYELANLALATLTLMVLLIFARYLMAERKLGRFNFAIWWGGGQVALRHQMAIALATMTLGESILRWWTWWARMGVNLGGDMTWMGASAVPRLAVIIQCWGLLCAIKVFSPDEWGSHARVWFGCVSLVLLEFIASAVVHHWMGHPLTRWW